LESRTESPSYWISSLGVYDGIAHFNDGDIAAIRILEKLEPGDHIYEGLHCQNVSRKRRSAYRMSEDQLKRRKIIRHSRKQKQDRNIDKEGSTYEVGEFNSCYSGYVHYNRGGYSHLKMCQYFVFHTIFNIFSVFDFSARPVCS